MEVIVGHVNADFDALGAVLAGAALYPGAVAVLPGGEGANVHDFLALHRDALDLRRPNEVDADTITRVVVVDTPSRRRLGDAAAWLDLPEVAIELWDHHMATEPDLGAVESRRSVVGATCTLLAAALQRAEIVPDAVTATAMLLGIYEDTGCLAFSSATPEDLEAAAWLLRSGAKLEAVADYLQRGLTREQRRLHRALREALERHDFAGERIGIAVAPPGPHIAEAAGVADRLLDEERLDAFLMIALMDGSLHCIGRASSEGVDVGGLLRELGGGGHRRAASASLRSDDPQAFHDRLVAALPRFVTREETAAELMSSPVRSVGPDATVDEAAREMLRSGHSGLAVMEGERLAGILTRRDVDRARHHQLGHSPVSSYMSREVETALPDTSLSRLERLIIGKQIGRIPVLSDGKVVGIVTRTDVLRARFGARYAADAHAPNAPTFAEQMAELLPASAQRLLGTVGEQAAELDAHAYVVGGFVRDVLLGMRCLDLDILVEPDAAALAAAVAEAVGGELKLEERFGAAKVTQASGLRLDFTTARTESYAQPGALPEVEASSVKDDLRRRDFTINAMAASLLPESFGEILDPFHGRRDLEQRTLRILHNLSFIEDPTRIIRAVVFEQRYRFGMEPETERLAREAVTHGRLRSITPERLRRALALALGESRVAAVVKRLGELGVLQQLAPNVRPDGGLLSRVPKAVEWLRREGLPGSEELTSLSALVLTGGIPAARALSEALRLTPGEVKIVEAAVAAEPAALLAESPPAEVVERLRPLPPEALALLRARTVRPDSESGVTEGAGKRLEQYIREWRNDRLSLNGDLLKSRGHAASPLMGEALRATLRARLNGELSTPEAELEYAERFLAGRGDGKMAAALRAGQSRTEQSRSGG